MVLVVHPAAPGHAEMLAGLDLAHPESRRVRQALVDWDGAQEQSDLETGDDIRSAGIVRGRRRARPPREPRETLERAGLVQELARLELAVRPATAGVLTPKPIPRSQGKSQAGDHLASPRA